MRKLICLCLATLLVIPLLLIACNRTDSNPDTPEKYTVVGLGVIKHDVQEQYGLKSEEYTRFKIFKHKTITVNGEKIKGIYQETTKDHNYNSATDHYETEDGKVEFAINIKTGKCIRFNDKRDHDLGNDLKSRDECLEIAQECLKEYVGDLDNYELFGEKGPEASSHRYGFSFIRKENGFSTKETASVYVYEDGCIESYYFRNLCQTKGVDAPTDEELEKATDAMLAYLEAFNPKYKVEKYSASLTRLANGERALEFETAVSSDYASQVFHIVVYL